eukprot:scaffold4124_cov29-Prasinocladus_malaysianus.AAC.2
MISLNFISLASSSRILEAASPLPAGPETTVENRRTPALPPPAQIVTPHRGRGAPHAWRPTLGSDW